MPRFAAPALLTACLVLILAACGGSAAGASDAPEAPATDVPATSLPAEVPAEPEAPVAGTDLNACEILTAADVAAAAGVDAADVPEGTFEETPTTLSPGQTECTYEWEGGRVIVELTPEDGANLYDAARGSYADASDIANHGGDGAFFSADNNRSFFWKGAVAVMLTHFLSDSEQLRPFAEELGKAAIAKI